METIVLGPGESRPIEGHPARIKASSEDCDERFFVLESIIEPGQGPRMHLHRRHLEAFYVLEGALEIQAGRATIPAPAGSFVLAPPGSPHAFTNPGPGPTRFLGFGAPGGLDRFLAGLGAIMGQPGPPDLQALGELLREYDSAAVEGDPPDGPASVVVASGEGDAVTIAGNTIVFKTEARGTNGAFGLVEYTAAPRFPGPPPHVHRELADMFFVLEGELAMLVGDETRAAPAGTFVLVAPGTVHTFSNPHDAPARFLSLVSPGGFEQYFRDLAQALGEGPLVPATISELVAKYDFELPGQIPGQGQVGDKPSGPVPSQSPVVPPVEPPRVELAPPVEETAEPEPEPELPPVPPVSPEELVAAGDVVLLGPGEGETVSSSERRDVVIKVGEELMDVTWARYAVGERGPDPHVHRQHADAFYVLDGELVFGVGPELEQIRAGAGTLVIVPAGVVHTFGNEAEPDAMYLNLHAPSRGFAESLRARRDGREVGPELFDSFDPPSDGGAPASRVVVRGPGAGDSISLGPSRAVFKAEVGDGDGTFSMTEIALAPGFPGPVPHRHREHLDTFYVLEGTLTVRVGDELVDVEPGSFAVVPPGNVHTFSNRSGEPVRALNVMAPGGFEQYLKEAAAATGDGPPDPAMLAQIASRYDFEPIE